MRLARHAGFPQPSPHDMALAPPSLAMTIVEIGDLPLYNQDLETASPPAPWQAFRDAIRAAHLRCGRRCSGVGRLVVVVTAGTLIALVGAVVLRLTLSDAYLRYVQNGPLASDIVEKIRAAYRRADPKADWKGQI